MILLLPFPRPGAFGNVRPVRVCLYFAAAGNQFQVLKNYATARSIRKLLRNLSCSSSTLTQNSALLPRVRFSRRYLEGVNDLLNGGRGVMI